MESKCFLVFATSICSQLILGNGHVLRSKSESIGLINGNETSISQYPFMAALIVDGSLLGSGVILNDEWILTTAYNVQDLEETQGTFRVGSDSCLSGGQLLKSTKITIHKSFQQLWDYDIAVVKVNKMKMGDNVKAAKLGTKKLKTNTTVKIAGWGGKYEEEFYNEQLLDSNLTVWDWNTCEEEFKDLFSKRMMCTYDDNKGPSMGDTGNPVMLDGKVFGLFSGGDGAEKPKVYVNIPSFISWIRNAIKE